MSTTQDRPRDLFETIVRVVWRDIPVELDHTRRMDQRAASDIVIYQLFSIVVLSYETCQ